ncbi:Putative multicomponent Na+:H+ antiporter subunit B [Cyanobacterium sp. HL-69]|uniref:hydrogenase subunit MbhD domain-containing protein n=1 Tax=Cyanobacterium sp. HL-69 TaxID=2054282 RepID=UPI000CA0C8C1|nr:Putative multicomponent Na+:H+ antiporter subunit B [Cyanobacterium sp. HL-69]
MENLYIYIITALMPISALLLILQPNPYYALVIRGILGAVAVLVYVILGGADVALTEALVGTLLTIALYVIAIRSSMIVKIGVLTENETSTELTEISDKLKGIISQHYLRLELLTYDTEKQLNYALENQDIHGIINCSTSIEDNSISPYKTIVRIPRIYEIIEPEINYVFMNKKLEGTIKH